MDFIHTPYQPGETIAAIATPPGEGGVAIIRISGSNALCIASKVFSGPVTTYKSHSAHYGTIHNENGEPIDHVLLLVMLGKRSYTGEDTVEIHCHGGSLITRRVLETVLQAGARAAKPGEFTFKAFINGKIDLVQAESVQTLIGAKNEYALDAAQQHLAGALSKRINVFQKELTSLAAILEAWVDFPEEGLEFTSFEQLCADLESLSQQMQYLASTFEEGRILNDGITLCLIGSPNVGKSSLMNALLDHERAIVSPIPGTTRDILEDNMKLNGLNLRLIDTAGIRETDEIIEQEGVRRSKLVMQKSDLILLVLDSSRGITAEEKNLLTSIPHDKGIVVWNKMDLISKDNSHCSLKEVFPHVAVISAKERLGLEVLKKLIDNVIWQKGAPNKEEIIITNVRHKESLLNAIKACHNVINGLRDGVSPEFLAFDIRKSLSELGKIIGTNITEDILSSIFSKFCIGK